MKLYRTLISVLIQFRDINLTFNKKDMKVLLDIKDSKALHLLEVLKSLPYVKTRQLTDEEAQVMGDLREAVEEMKLIRAGKKQARDAEDFLNEL